MSPPPSPHDPESAGPNPVTGQPCGPPGGALDLGGIFALEPTSFLRRMPGRETFVWPGRPERIVKRFRGDEPRDWWYERFHGTRPRSPARREAENLLALAGDGLPVPALPAWVEEPDVRFHPRFGGRGARSALVMECVVHKEDLRTRLAGAPDDLGDIDGIEAWIAPLVELVARLHRAGWYHRDLYLQHIVLRGSELVLLDVGRARREAHPRRRWFVKDLAALLHSTPSAVSPELRRRFLQGWLSATAFSGSPEWWSRAVTAKARALSAHAPRHVDLDGPRPEPR